MKKVGQTTTILGSRSLSKLNEDSLDNLFFALSDRNRRKILKKISSESASVSELAENLSISLPGIMKHLGILEKAQLVRLEKNGRVRSCSFDLEGFDKASTYIEEYREFWNEKFDNIEKMLLEKKE